MNTTANPPGQIFIKGKDQDPAVLLGEISRSVVFGAYPDRLYLNGSMLRIVDADVAKKAIRYGWEIAVTFKIAGNLTDFLKSIEPQGRVLVSASGDYFTPEFINALESYPFAIASHRVDHEGDGSVTILTLSRWALTIPYRRGTA